jgi:asparagine synthetase B (glutamine-hydrolysing)
MVSGRRRQPIYQGKDILVVNGEIYNHADLRAILRWVVQAWPRNAWAPPCA